jgi:hypothetical protein
MFEYSRAFSRCYFNRVNPKENINKTASRLNVMCQLPPTQKSKQNTENSQFAKLHVFGHSK